MQDSKHKLIRIRDMAKMGMSLGMGIVMITIFLLIGFGVFYSVNTTVYTNTSSSNQSTWIANPWNSTVLTIWGYIPLIVIAVTIAAIAAYIGYSNRQE